MHIVVLQAHQGSRALTGVASARILPQDTASSGRAPESLPSNSCAVLTYTAKSAPLRIRLALQMWCLGRPAQGHEHCVIGLAEVST